MENIENKEFGAVEKPVEKANDTAGREQTRTEPRERPRRYPQQQRRSNNPKAQFNPRFKKRVCRFCKGMIKDIDYKNVEMIRRFVSERGKILPRRITGTCAKHQRLLAKEIKRARILALLPFVADK